MAWAESIVAELRRGGLTTFFVSPGSRSTPLVLAVARRDDVQTVVHFDERGSAFAALGYARATGLPAAVITTSGTAVANLLPAVIEASMDAQPLLVLSADRPPELRGTGANQTIDQVGIFGEYVRYSCDLPAPDSEIDISLAQRSVREALAAATSVNPGPVHMNCMFRKPLAPPYTLPIRVDPSPPTYPRDQHALEQESWADPVPRFQESVTSTQPQLRQCEDEERAVRAINNLVGYSKGIVLAGRLQSRRDGDAVVAAAEHLGWPILADIGSQVPRTEAGSIVISFDQLLSAPEFLDLRPDCVLHIGGRFVSARLGRWLENIKPGMVLHVAANKVPYDPHGVVTERIHCDPTTFLSLLVANHKSTEGAAWRRRWLDGSRLAMEMLAESFSDLEADPLTEPAIANIVWSAMPAAWCLLVGNSMPVRDFDAFAWGASGPRLVATNRGASGIDGLVATACGVGLGAKSSVVAVIGDQSALHDLNSFALASRTERPVVLVIVNNDGGGIFSFLPIAEHEDVFEEYFGAPHGFRFDLVSRQFNLGYQTVTTCGELRRVLSNALRSGRSAVIEAKTSRAGNKTEHDSLATLIRQKVAGSTWEY